MSQFHEPIKAGNATTSPGSTQTNQKTLRPAKMRFQSLVMDDLIKSQSHRSTTDQKSPRQRTKKTRPPFLYVKIADRKPAIVETAEEKDLRILNALIRGMMLDMEFPFKESGRSEEVGVEVEEGSERDVEGVDEESEKESERGGIEGRDKEDMDEEILAAQANLSMNSLIGS